MYDLFPARSSSNSTTILQLSSEEPNKKIAKITSDPIQQLANNSQRMQHAIQLQSMADGYSNSMADRFTPNRTGLPDNLKTGVEQLSGYALDDVKVHYNSSKPSLMQAHAYAQGTDIHLAPGQEKHLPHEAWHVVQQKQGRVQPTIQLKGNVAVNDDNALEREADVMGNKALRTTESVSSSVKTAGPAAPSNVVQRVLHANPHVRMYGRLQLSQEAQDRMDEVAAILDRMLHNDQTININQLVLSIELEGGIDYNGQQSTIQGDNPAETSSIPAQNGGHPGIQVTIQRAFAEKATIGEMLGLLAHEIGVHTIPSHFKGVNDFNVNQWNPVVTPRKQSKGNTVSGGYEFQNWGPQQVNGATPQRDGNRQHDHLQVVDVLHNPPQPGFVPNTRAEVYLDTVLKIGDEIWADNNLSQNERKSRAEDLIHLYLVDIARIVASDDGRMNPKDHFIALSDVYGEVFDNVVLPLQGNHPWIPNKRPKENFFTLSISLAWFIKRVKDEKEKNG